MPATYINYLRGIKHEGKKHSREAGFFLFSQYFADGIRITLSILLPTLILSYYGHFATGLIISIGAFAVSITDIPGPVIYKRNSMLMCILLNTIVAIITGFARMSNITMAAEIMLFAFLFSMLLVYGSRAGAVGSAGLLIMILLMDEPLEASQVFMHGFMIMAGGLWYMIISLSVSVIQPYRPAQRALGDCIHEIAKFLHIKARFYDTNTELDKDYSLLLGQQITVSEKQETVREIFFKSRLIVKEATSTSRVLILTFIELIDLFEDISATYYDYTSVREKYANTGVLQQISILIKKIAEELDNAGFAMQANMQYKKTADIDKQLERLKTSIDKLSETENTSHIVLRKIFVNLRNLNHRLDNILLYFTAKPTKKVNSSGKLDYSKFVTRQRIDLKILRENFSFNSSIFRHSLRMSIACLLGFIVSQFFAPGKHSYWILLTIAFILKPAFSLTKQRNYQRLTGTLAGGLIGGLILYFIPDENILFAIMVVFMVGAYSFMRTNYIVMVIFVTPYVLILFRFYGAGYVDVIQERIADTAIGCAIALCASYLIFPSWEKHQIQTHLKNLLAANAGYLHQLASILTGRQPNIAEYKLARKDVYVQSANLSAAFQRMLSEPKNKQQNSKDVHQFVVVNHVLSSNISGLASSMFQKELPALSEENLKQLKQSFSLLNQSIKKLDPDGKIISTEMLVGHKGRELQNTEDVKHLLEQLEFIYRLSYDINKLTDKLLTDS